MSPQERLETFIDKYKDLPLQGTIEWKQLRRIGASDLGSILDKNPYKSIKQFLYDKVGLGKEFCGNEYTQWGSFFEPIHRSYLEKLFTAEIVDTFSSIPYGTDDKAGFRVSPDGVAIIPRNNLIKVFGQSQVDEALPNNQSEVITLFELKAPARRVLDETIPKYYEPQPMSGMCVINISECAIFTEAVFRRSPLKYMFPDNDEYTKSFSVCESFERPKEGVLSRDTWPIMGIVAVFTNNNNSCRKLKKSYFGRNYSSADLVDFGECEPDIFFNMLSLKEEGQISYAYLNEIPEDNLYETLIELTPELSSKGRGSNWNLVGYVPWKIFDLSLHLMTKDPRYLEKCWPSISCVLKVIEYCKGKDEDDKKNIVNIGVAKIRQLNITNGV